MRSLGCVLAVLAATLVVLSASPVSFADDGNDVTIEGYVSSVIKDKKTFLNNAEIVATGENGTGQATSNQNGFFIMSCPPGTYTLTVKCSGFEPVTLDKVTAGGSPVEVRMTLKDNSLIWGLDIPHTLEAVGILSLLAIIAIGILIHMHRKSDNITVIDDDDIPEDALYDLEELEKGEEDEEYVYDDDLKDP